MSFSKPTAKIIADSISPDGIRLTTMECRFHRFILAEMNTHRAFSRNSASSRAIPIAKQLEKVKNDPAMPLFWAKNQAGMGAAEELIPEKLEEAQELWLDARDRAVEIVQDLQTLGLHKQLANRLLEPFMWHTAIISSTEWMNFFGQRSAINPEYNQPFAQQETFEISQAMQAAYYQSTPTYVDYGRWHLPYITKEDWWDAIQYAATNSLDSIEVLKKVSTGRCARVSYLTHDGKRDLLEDIKLADKLASAKPMHPSPFEHVARPWHPDDSEGVWDYKTKGNFTGWHQYRHEFPNENITEFTPNYQVSIKEE